MASAGGTNGSPPERQHGAVPGTASGGTALLVTLAMAQFMVVLDFTIVNVALPSIQHGLHVATTTLQWLVSAYAVTFGGAGSASSSLPASGGLAIEPKLLVASRAVQGLGAALLAPAGLSLLITRWPDGQQRSHALGVYGAVASTGFAAGAVTGGLLVEVSWRLVFFVNVPVGVALFACPGASSRPTRPAVPDSSTSPGHSPRPPAWPCSCSA